MLEALLVMGLIDQRREKNLTWLHLSALAPDVFRGGPANLPASDDPLAGVPHARNRRRVKLISPPEDEGMM